MFKKIVNILSAMKTIYLVLIPVALGILLILISLGLAMISQSANQIGNFLIPFAFFIWGFTGLPMIVRKEVPWLITVRGWLAVAEGIFLMLGLWWVAIILTQAMLSGK